MKKLLFIRSLRAELLKTKSTSVIWLTLLAAALLPAINSLILIQRPDYFLDKFASSPWLSFFRMSWKNGAPIILPLFVILLNNVIVQIEYRNNTWKQVYAAPRTYADIFFSKFLIVHVYLILFFLLINTFIIAGGYLVGYIESRYFFSAKPIPFSSMLLTCSRIYLGVMGISAIQYWLSVRFRNFIVPLGVGIGLWITGLVLMDWEKVFYYPYMYPGLMLFIGSSKSICTVSDLVVNSIVCVVVFITLGYWNMYRLKERG